MIRKIFLFFLITSLLFGQKKNKIPNYIEHNSILGTNSQVEYLTYRIPYNALLFTRDKDQYRAEFTLSLEIYKDKTFLKRDINKYEVLSSNYDDTKSEEKYFQDLVKLNLQPGNYSFNYAFTISETDVNTKLPPLELEIKELKKEKVFPPIIVNNEIIKANNASFKFKLTNFQNNIPFSPEQYNLLVGVVDTTVKSIQVNIKQDGKNILESSVNRLFKNGIFFEKSKEDIIIKSIKDSVNLSYFLIKNFSNHLYEGKFEVKIKINNEEKTFPLKVVWNDKPKVLNKPEYAIKLLSYIEDINVVKSLLKSESKNYYKELFKYWEKKYPSKNRKYNFALKEYYSRVDYTIKNFTSLKGRKGAESDRGRIYIIYGKPTSTERNYNEKNETIEIWKYASINKIFVFKDITGTGKFILVK